MSEAFEDSAFKNSNWVADNADCLEDQVDRSPVESVRSLISNSSASCGVDQAPLRLVVSAKSLISKSFAD